MCATGSMHSYNFIVGTKHLIRFAYVQLIFDQIHFQLKFTHRNGKSYLAKVEYVIFIIQIFTNARQTVLDAIFYAC